MAQLIISERQAGEFVVLDLEGDILFGEDTEVLRQTVRRLIGDGRNKISLNLEKVFYVDSGGIGELISTLTAVNREKDGHLRILNPTERIYQLLEISKLLKIFDISFEENGESAAGGSGAS